MASAMRRFVCAALASFAAASAPVAALAARSPADIRIAFVPIDDRPATSLFPARVAAICGVSLELPPAEALGHFQRPGDPGAIERWLAALDDRRTTALVIATDMLAYGGLVASRTPAVRLGDALARLRALTLFRATHPDVPIYAFGTVMRLAPTATPGAEPYLDALAHYAQLAGAVDPSPDQRAALAISRSNIPDAAFWDYIGSRARDLAVDERLLAMASDGDFAALALTQDDAGAPDGLQAPDQRRLHATASALSLGARVLLNPGTDEMGMVMVVRAIEDAVGWSPRLDVEYASDAAASAWDRLEYQPIRDTVSGLAGFLRMTSGGAADFELDVVAPDPDAGAWGALEARIRERLAARRPTAIADLSFLADDPTLEHATFAMLEGTRVADRPLAFASWNTTANTVGTTLATAAASLIGRRFDTYSRAAAATFLFERYADDIAYRLDVRPVLQAQLRDAGADVYALGAFAGQGESAARRFLWPDAVAIFDRDFAPAGFEDRGITIGLPWQRTFEVRIDAALEDQGGGPSPSS